MLMECQILNVKRDAHLYHTYIITSLLDAGHEGIEL